MIVLEVKFAKCSRLRSMKAIVSDHVIAAAVPGRERRWSWRSRRLHQKAADFSTSATARFTKIILGMGRLLSGSIFSDFEFGWHTAVSYKKQP